MEHKGYVWRSLQRHLPEKVTEKLVGMRFMKDRMASNFYLLVDEITLISSIQLY